jgi:hypothetical protein
VDSSHRIRIRHPILTVIISEMEGEPRLTAKPTIDSEQRKTFQVLHQNNILLNKAGPNGIALVAGIKGSLLPHCGITTHEYYFSDRLIADRTQSVAGRNKSESSRSIDHEHLIVGR